MKNIPILLCLVLSQTLAGSALAQATWVHLDSNNNLVYKTDNMGNRIPDFSFAGYEGGGVALPQNVSVKQTLSPSGGDDTANIQNAINAVEALSPDGNGIRGAVKLNSGTFQVSATLNITNGGVVLEGSGTNNTILNCTGASRLCISVTGSGSRTTVGSTVHITDNYVPLGSTSFDVDDASSFSVGNTIVVNRARTQVWIDAIGMSAFWSPNGGISFERTITAISGNKISIDIPLCNPIEMQYVTGAVYQFTFTGRISQVGLQDFQIKGNFNDYATHLGNGRAIQFDKCENCWASDLLLNHFYNGFNLGNNSKWVTVQDSEYVHNTGTNAGPDAYASQGGLNLYLRCGSTADCTLYHVGGTQSATPGPIVLLDINSVGTAYDCEAHQNWACGCLYDRTVVAATSGNTGIKYQNRGGAGGGQGYAAGYSVMWNCDSKGSINEIPQVANHYNWAIGRGSSAATWTHFSDDGVFDATNETVTPSSIYLRQLDDRLGAGAVENIGYTAFGISASPGSQSVNAGSSTSYTVTISENLNLNDTVSLSVSGLPSGAGGSFSPSSVTGSGSSTLTVTTSSSTPAGTYTLTIAGASGGASHSTTVTLKVASISDFSISATPSSQTVTAGGGTSYTVNLGNINGFTGTISLSDSGLPSGASASFNPSSLTAPGSSTMSVTTSGSTPTGSNTLTITGTSGSLQHSTTVGLAVTAAPDFTLSASPNALTITQGANGTSTITVNPLNGYTGTVSLSASGLPGGVTSSFNPSSTTSTSTLTLTASSSATTGSSTVTVTGTDGTLTHTTGINLTVNPANTNNFAGTFKIENEASGLVLNNQGSLTNGSAITQWTATTTSSNLDWTFIATSNGYYQINSSKSGLDAVVHGAATTNGAGIIQWSFGSSGDDQWKPVANSDGSYTFFNLHSGLVLGDPGSSTNKTTQMDQEASTGGSNQKWNLLQQ